MANLDRIANVQISLRTTAITELSFSDLLILGTHVLSPARTMVITGPDELLDAGLSDQDPLYFAARDAFSAMPSVRQVFIGRRNADAPELLVTTAAEAEYAVTLQWRDANGSIQSATGKYTGLALDSVDDVAEALAIAINGTDAPVTAVATDASVAITPTTTGDSIGVHASGNVIVSTLTSSEGVAEALAAVNGEMSNWYGLVLASRAELDVKAAMAWAESNGKLFGTASDDTDILDAGAAGDIASYAKANQYFRSFVMYSGKASTSYPEATWMSECFTYYPGVEGWALKQLPGIAYDALQEGQFIAASTKNASTFELFRNFAVTQGGKVGAGEWIDIIRLRDALVDQIKVSVVSTMINADGKVPYEDDGIQLIGTGIRAPLDLNVRRGGLAKEELDDQNRVIPSYTILLPRSSQVPFNDKANRILRDAKFTARLSGAIYVTEINGSLSYQL